MQRYTIFFIIVTAVYVSGGFSAHHQELKNCTHTASGTCKACLLPTLAVAASKTGMYQMLCVYSFWAPDDGRRNHPKHVEHWQ
jgi:hypothetical protein